MQKLQYILCMLLIGIAFTLGSRAAESTVVEKCSTQLTNDWYPSCSAPLSAQSFIKLPTGSIQPEGWLRTTLELQKDGLCGHLGEISAWLQKDNNAWLTEGGEWGWEEVPYWLRGYSDMAFILGDKQMIDESLIWIEAILNSQKEDGNFGPVAMRYGSQDLWPNMIALSILQNYYEWTETQGKPDKRVLTFMARYFAFQLTIPDDHFLEDFWENSRAGDNLWSVAWLYSRTGDQTLLPLAEKLHHNAADWTQPQQLPNWHNVNVAQCFREPAIYSLFSHDEAHIRASYNVHRLIRKEYGQVPGGMFGADEIARMGYIDPRQGTETCAFAEQMFSDEIMLLITGDPYWAAHCEDVTFNSLPAAFMDDYRALRYITSPNMVVSDSKNHAPGILNPGPFLSMNPFSSRCCQHNHGFAWPYYNDHLILATPDNGIAAMLYNACTATARVGDQGKTIIVKESTDYPFSDHITFTLDIAKAKKSRKGSEGVIFPFWLRMPEWCDAPQVTVNGTTVDVIPAPGQYLRIERTWNSGDVVEVSLPMHISMRHWQVNNNSVSVDYGPLTLSLEIPEEYRQVNSKDNAISDSKWQADVDVNQWPTTEIYPMAPWNYALCTAEAIELVETRPVEAGINPFRWDYAPLVFKAKGRLVPSWTIDEYGLCAPLPYEDEPLSAEVCDIHLIPMGAARLRISAFPDAENFRHNNLKNDKMNPLILVASPEEERLVKKYLPEYACHVMGIGASNVIHSLCELPKGTPAVNIGFAGSTNLPIGSVSLVSTTWRLKNEEFKFDDYRHGYQLSEQGLPCYTSNSFVTSTDMEGSILFDMELNYIAAFPIDLLGAIKIVSDNLCLEDYKHNITRDEDDIWEDVRRCLEKMVK